MTQTTVASMNGLWLDRVYEDAVFAARARTLMASSGIVTTFNDRTGDEARDLPEYVRGTAAEVAETADYTAAQELTKGTAGSLSIKEAIAQFLVTDRRFESDPDDVRNAAAVELGNALSTKIDTDMTALFASFTGGGGTIGVGTTALSWGQLFAARSRLAAGGTTGNTVPGPYVAVLHEYHWFNLAKSASVAGAQTNASAALLDDVNRGYYVASVGDMDIFVSNNISAGTATGNPAVSGVFNRQAIALDMRRAPRLEPDRDASARATELNMTVKYAAGVWRPSFGIPVLASAALPTS